MYLRLSNYYQARYLQRCLSSSLICRAIFKEGIEAFELLILVPTLFLVHKKKKGLDPVDLSEAEQY